MDGKQQIEKMPPNIKGADMIYVLPFDLYKDWKDLMFAKEVSKALFEELKAHREKGV